MATQRDRVAYHEAGHVTIALVDGLDLRSASIEPEPVVLTDWRRTVFSTTPTAWRGFISADFVLSRASRRRPPARSTVGSISSARANRSARKVTGSSC